MMSEWDRILERHIYNLISPDGRNTFESTSFLVEKILQRANIGQDDIIVDVGCGWGNLTRACSLQTQQTVIGIDPSIKNMKEAERKSVSYNVKFIQGSFEQMNYNKKTDIIVSSLTFHQVKDKKCALKNVKDILRKKGKFILCDTLIMFDAENDSTQFDCVYRYLLEKTTPPDIYRKYISPNLQDGYIYSWEDMKRYTPKEFWFYSLKDLQGWSALSGLSIIQVEPICPFFGIITFVNGVDNDER